ncbi:hypothetical protein LQZ21_02835 [Treponema sp. TIM-1]|uniref:hypothetical protein n=1 Tax=Treponema sp. TIM-1 TaxID=2898417 RepID=UPI003980DD7F
MKKVLICALLLFLTLTAGTFADHPSGTGIGLDFRYGVTGGFGPALSLKLPVVPVYWGIGLGIDRNWFGLNVTGDYYFIDKVLVPEINLGWYLGLGGYTGLWIWQDNYHPAWAKDDDLDMSLTMGLRFPIGLSWQPLDFLEVFMDVAPSLGLWVIPFRFPDWDVNFDLGVRFWI